jgi:hypothetical protein
MDFSPGSEAPEDGASTLSAHRESLSVSVSEAVIVLQQLSTDRWTTLGINLCSQSREPEEWRRFIGLLQN